MSNADFFQTYLIDAVNASKQTGVLTSVILAQWADETRYGTSSAFTQGHNFAGVSYSGVSSFPDEPTGLAAYVKTLQLSYYDGVRSASGSQAQARALGRSPWAASHYDFNGYLAAGSPADGTWQSPNPGIDLLSIISQNNLTRFDSLKAKGTASPGQVVSISSDISPDFLPNQAPFEPYPGSQGPETLMIAGQDLAKILLPGSPIPLGRKLSDQVIIMMSEVDLTSDMVSEITFMFADPSFELMKGLIMVGQDAEWLGMQLMVAAIETSDGGSGGLGGGGMGAGGQVQVSFRSKGAQLLKQRWGMKSWVNLSPTEVMQSECEAVGLNFVGQGSAVRAQITRIDQTLGGTYLVDYTSGQYIVPDTSWTTGQRLAAETGFVAFEAAGTYYFAQPSWLANNLPVINLNWPPQPGDDPRLALLGPPQYRRSLDDMNGLAVLRNIDASTITFAMDRAAGEAVRPGMCVDFNGIADFISGRYLVTDVRWYVDGGVTAVEVDAARPVDPVPSLPGLSYADAAAPGTTGTANPARASGSASAMDFVSLAIAQSGKTYVWGANDPASNVSPTGFDCSSLVQWCAARLGVSLPRVSGDQWLACSMDQISVADAMRTRGALLFVDSPGVPGGQHVAISLGDGSNVIEALNQRYGVGQYPADWTPFDRAALVPAFDYGVGVGKAPKGITII